MNKSQLRRALIERRQTLPDWMDRARALQAVLRVWLAQRALDADAPQVIGAYWPIKGEFDPLPTLQRWREDGAVGAVADLACVRHIGLPVVDAASKTMQFHAWQPGCPMQDDAYGIPKPVGTARVWPDLLLVPCVGYGPGGYRLGYGGGFYDRALAAMNPKPRTLGLAFSCGFIDDFEPQPHDAPLDAILNENGCVWPVDAQWQDYLCDDE